MSKLTKDSAKKIQEVCKELGYDFKLSHAYELIAKLEGHKSWNVMSAKENEPNKKEVSLSVDSPNRVILFYGEGKNEYIVKNKAIAEVATVFVVRANSKEEALSEAVFLNEDESIPNDNWKTVFVKNESMRVTEIDCFETGEHISFESTFQKEFSMNLDTYKHVYGFYEDKFLINVDISDDEIAMIGALIPELLILPNEEDSADLYQARVAFLKLQHRRNDIARNALESLLKVMKEYSKNFEISGGRPLLKKVMSRLGSILVD